MSNMSYCRFENTQADLRDCVNALDEEGLPESESEKGACDGMWELCETYMRLYTEKVEEAEDFDDRPDTSFQAALDSE